MDLFISFEGEWGGRGPASTCHSVPPFPRPVAQKWRWPLLPGWTGDTTHWASTTAACRQQQQPPPPYSVWAQTPWNETHGPYRWTIGHSGREQTHCDFTATTQPAGPAAFWKCWNIGVSSKCFITEMAEHGIAIVQQWKAYASSTQKHCTL